MREAITVDHVLASAAIPLFFPPVRIGGAYFGDGCIRMLAPVSPAIHLGAGRIIAIGVRHKRSADETARRQLTTQRSSLPLAEIIGALMNASRSGTQSVNSCPNPTDCIPGKLARSSLARVPMRLRRRRQASTWAPWRTVDLVERVSTGIEPSGDVLRLDPRTAREIDLVDLRVRYRELSLDLRVTREALTVRARERASAPIPLRVGDEVHEFAGGGRRVFPLARET